jgi:CRP/FNR family transcriptional regulator, anaerobic regulatory protein
MSTTPKPLDRLLATLETKRFVTIKDKFKEMMVPLYFKKGRIIVGLGQINDSIYLIEKGVIRTYYQKGFEDITARMISEGEIANIAESFFSHSPSMEIMETLEDTKVWAISYIDYRALAHQEHLVAELIIQLLEERLVNFSEKVRLFKSMTVTERIQYYIQSPGSLYRRVPDHYIATYLGMTPSTFSRCLKSYFRDVEG